MDASAAARARSQPTSVIRRGSRSAHTPLGKPKSSHDTLASAAIRPTSNTEACSDSSATNGRRTVVMAEPRALTDAADHSRPTLDRRGRRSVIPGMIPFLFPWMSAAPPSKAQPITRELLVRQSEDGPEADLLDGRPGVFLHRAPPSYKLSPCRRGITDSRPGPVPGMTAARCGSTSRALP